MRLTDFDYNLPKNLIAQEPKKPRDHSRLLILEKQSGKIRHKHFYNIIDYLQKGDVLVLNNTKVFPARLIGKRKETGGKVEVFLLRKVEPTLPTGQAGPPLPFAKGGSMVSSSLPKGRSGGVLEIWQCLVGGHRRKENLIVEFGDGLRAEILKDNNDGTFLVGFNKKGKALMNIVNKIGLVPLPPYIKREPTPTLPLSKGGRTFSSPLRKGRLGGVLEDIYNYQTIYADEKKVGSVAAPTAGFHFTPALINKLKKIGVQFEYVTLHVGLGTFAPVKVDDITKHKMHSEWVEVKAGVIKNIIKAKQEGRRIVAVGTTSVRTLEAVALKFSIFNFQFSPLSSGIPPSKKTLSGGTNNFQFFNELNSKIFNFSDFINIFIYPGYEFKIIDAMITNFHLPKSTLFMLVSALAGQEKIKNAYREAIKKKYRFFSYGDAMLIY